MKSRLIALSVVMSLTINQTALAATMGGDVIVDPDLLAQTRNVSAQNMSASIQQIDSLISSINIIIKTNQEKSNNPIINGISNLLTALSIITLFLHSIGDKKDEATLSILTSSISGILSFFTEEYSESGRIGLSEVQKLLEENQAKLGINSQQLNADFEAINNLAQDVKSIYNGLDMRDENTVKKMEYAKSVGVAVALLGLVVKYSKYVTKLLSKDNQAKLNAYVLKSFPRLADQAKTTEIRAGQLGGVTSIANPLTFLIASNSPPVNEQLKKILVNLQTTRISMLTAQQKLK